VEVPAIVSGSRVPAIVSGSRVPATVSGSRVPAIVSGSRVPAKEADKVPAKEGRSSTVQADLTRGKREEEGSPNNREVRTRRMEMRSQFFERQPYRSCNSGESAIPESRATRATTSPIVRN